MRDIIDLMKIAEADLNMGLPAEALRELDDCLKAALPVLEKALAFAKSIEHGEFADDNQEQVVKMQTVVVRLSRVAMLKGNPKADLLDDTISAIDGFKMLVRCYGALYKLSDDQKSLLRENSDLWRRCYACLKVVGVGWGSSK